MNKESKDKETKSNLPRRLKAYVGGESESKEIDYFYYYNYENVSTKPGKNLDLESSFNDKKKEFDDINKAEKRKNVLVLTGENGVGKSALALEYAHRLINKGEVVRWFDCENVHNLIIESAIFLFESSKFENNQESKDFSRNILQMVEYSDIHHLFEYIFEKIQKLNKKRMLFVFDDLKLTEHFYYDLKYISTEANIKILITSKYANNYVDYPINIEHFKQEEAEEFIEKMKSEFLSEDVVAKIKNNFMKQNNVLNIFSLQKMVSNLIYKNLLEKKTKLESHFEELSIYENLKKNNPLAFEILKLCSLLNRYYITTDNLKALIEKDFDESLEILNKINLIEIDGDKVFIEKSIQEDFLRFIEFQEYKNTEYLQLLVKILKQFMKPNEDIDFFKDLLINQYELKNLKEKCKHYLHQISILKRIDFMKIENNIGNDQERSKLYEEIESLKQKFMVIGGELRFIR